MNGPKETAAREKQIELILWFEDDLPFVAADIALIERALENLMENALHYTPENGSVYIEVSFEKQVLIQVRDTGPGISEHELKHIFERFYHSDSLKKAENGHLGLGLAITSRIVQLHHGQINVSSEPGKGSCFSFALPAA